MLTDVAIPGDRNVIKKEAEKILKYKKLNNRNSTHVGCGSRSNTSNKKGDWNHFKITQTVPEQHTGKARNSEATENSHIGHCILREMLM
jgi:hypothetical protein